jgi:hypothetical protein
MSPWHVIAATAPCSTPLVSGLIRQRRKESEFLLPKQVTTVRQLPRRNTMRRKVHSRKRHPESRQASGMWWIVPVAATSPLPLCAGVHLATCSNMILCPESCDSFHNWSSKNSWCRQRQCKHRRGALQSQWMCSACGNLQFTTGTEFVAFMNGCSTPTPCKTRTCAQGKLPIMCCRWLAECGLMHAIACVAGALVCR